MKNDWNRRQVLAAPAAAGLGWLMNSRLAAAPTFKTKLKKAMIIGKPEEKSLLPLQQAGFDGVESNAILPLEEAEACRKVADKMKMRIHSVLRGWAEFNSDDPKKVEASIEVTANALHAAKGYGADAVLLVPCRIGGKGSPIVMPEAWEFEIEFDDKTGHLTKVAAGDQSKYKDYIEAHNRAVDTSTVAVKKLIPLAEKLKVIIALENVWNNLWVKPAIFRHFVASFQNPWVKAYFDIGNHVKYAPPEQWLLELGSLITKVHIKDFKLNPDGHGGSFVHPREGSVNWPLIRQTLDKIGYKDYLTIEDNGLTLEEFSKRLDQIIAGV